MPDTIDRSSQFAKTPSGWADLWFVEMSASDEDQKRWQERGDKVIARFVDDRQDTRGKGDTRINLFTANVQTLRALLYGKTPNVDVKRRFSDPGDDDARLAGEILQRMLNMDIERDDDTYAEALECALSDRLLPGLGVVRCRYEAEFEDREVPPMMGEGRELAPGYTENVKIEEDVEVDYVNWRDFKWSPARTWDEVRWIAFRCPMTKDALAERFGEEKLKDIPMNAAGVGKPSTDVDDGEKNHPWTRAEVWEIWSKEHRQIFWWVKGCPYVLDEKADTLELEGFWPTPRPMFANLTTKKLIPTPDFTLSQDIYDEIDYVSTRITLLERAIAARGVYDKNSTEVKRLFNESMENDLIPVEGFAMFKEKGGLQSVIDWLPIENFVQALDVLRGYRVELQALLYQVTGMSDIMRGQSSNGATATEQALKAKFASTRVQEFQNEFARFASDTQKIKAEIISKHFDPETIAKRAERAVHDRLRPAEGAERHRSDQVVHLPVPRRGQARVDRHGRHGGGEAGAQRVPPGRLPVPPEQPADRPGRSLGRALPPPDPAWAMAGFRGGATIEGVLDQMVTQAQQQLLQAQQQPPPPNPEMVKAQMEMQKMQAEMQIDQQQSQMELQIKKVEMQMRQQEMQMELMAKAFGIQLEQKKLQMGMEVAQQKAQVDLQKTQMDGELAKEQAQFDFEAQAKQMALDEEKSIRDHERGMEQSDAQHEQKMKQAKEAKPKGGRDGKA